jgi:hypothetical protein
MGNGPSPQGCNQNRQGIDHGIAPWVWNEKQWGFACAMALWGGNENRRELLMDGPIIASWGRHFDTWPQRASVIAQVLAPWAAMQHTKKGTWAPQDGNEKKTGELITKWFFRQGCIPNALGNHDSGVWPEGAAKKGGAS